MAEQPTLTDEQQLIARAEMRTIMQSLFTLKQTMPESVTVKGGTLDQFTKLGDVLRDELDPIPF